MILLYIDFSVDDTVICEKARIGDNVIYNYNVVDEEVEVVLDSVVSPEVLQ